MSNNVYEKARNAFLTGQLDWVTDDMTVALIVDTYTPDEVNHEFLSDLPTDAIVASQIATNRQTDGQGTALADDTVFTAVTGDTIGGLVIYKDTGTDSSSRLVAFVFNHPALPISPNGEDIAIEWDDAGIFQI